MPKDRIIEVIDNWHKNEAWVNECAGFLVALEATILAGQTVMPFELQKALMYLLRGGIRRPEKESVKRGNRKP